LFHACRDLSRQQIVKYAPESARISSAMSDPVQIVAGILFVFFLPGFTMINMLFPRKGELDPEYDIVYRITLGMGLSIVISVIVGFGLNAVSSEEVGYVTSGPLWAVLLSITGLFALVGWWLGAYPRLGLMHPYLYRPPRISGIPQGWTSDFGRRRRTEKLILERGQLLLDVNAFADRMSTSDQKRKAYYRKRIDNARGRISQINEELDKLTEVK